nr:hypothetical protein [uncultured Prevotella sp.]
MVPYLLVSLSINSAPAHRPQERKLSFAIVLPVVGGCCTRHGQSPLLSSNCYVIKHWLL